MAIEDKDKKKLFKQFRHSMGAPLRQIELTNEQLCTILEMSIEDYAMYVQDWLVESQWHSVFGQQISTTDIAFALTVRDVDYMTQFTYAYSKQVGLQARGPWELKKDFITIEPGRQVYQIPAGREVNEVLWMTPPTTDQALFANYGGFDYGFGGGFAQVGSGIGVGGAGGAGGYGHGGAGHYIAPAFDVLMTAADFNIKNRLLRSDLVYKLTAGPDGTRLLHLLSTPGSRMSFGHGGVGGTSSSIGITGCQVWYHYYDTSGKDVDQCRNDNADIIKLPNEVPLDELEFSDMNPPTKTLIRTLFIAEAKKALGRVRGKFGGVVGPPEAERTMDYESLISEGNEEKQRYLERLDARLEKLSTLKQLEKAAQESEFLNQHLQKRPLGFFVY
jgi:hypothetical protein